MRGTSSTEYIIILSVVLIIGIIAASLLGFFPSWGGEARESQNTAYWAQKTPLSIADAQRDGGHLKLVMENKGGAALKLSRVTAKGEGSGNSYDKYFDPNVVFDPGARRVVDVGLAESEGSGNINIGYCVSSGDAQTCIPVDPNPIPCANCNEPITCAVAGMPCNGDPATCCSTNCQGGNCCLSNGEFCSGAASECCDSGSGCNGNVCCHGGIGAQCSTPFDCCMDSGHTLSCEHASCCLPDASAGCGTDGSKCCSGECDGGICMPASPPPLCLPRGAPTSDPSQCCPDTQYFDGYCRIASGECAYPTDCLSNSCGQDHQCASACSQIGGICSPQSCCGDGVCNTGQHICEAPPCSHLNEQCNPQACCDGENLDCQLVGFQGGQGQYQCKAQASCTPLLGDCTDNSQCCGHESMGGNICFGTHFPDNSCRQVCCIQPYSPVHCTSDYECCSNPNATCVNHMCILHGALCGCTTGQPPQCP